MRHQKTWCGCIKRLPSNMRGAPPVQETHVPCIYVGRGLRIGARKVHREFGRGENGGDDQVLVDTLGILSSVFLEGAILFAVCAVVHGVRGEGSARKTAIPLCFVVAKWGWALRRALEMFGWMFFIAPPLHDHRLCRILWYLLFRTYLAVRADFFFLYTRCPSPPAVRG